MKPLTFHSEADAEIDGAHDWYLRRSVDAADGFYEELFPALLRIVRQPRLYSQYIYGTRRLILQRYPFSIIFRELPDTIQIIAVAHAKRRPGYWKTRVKH